MGKHRKTLEEEVNEFLDIWNCKQICNFLRDIIPFFELYDVSDEKDWVEEAAGGDEENVRTIRLLRTVYLASRICESHAAVFCKTNTYFRRLWERMERQGVVGQEEYNEQD